MASGVWFAVEETGSIAQDHVRLAQLTTLPLQLTDPFLLAFGHPIAAAGINLRLTHPSVRRLGTKSKPGSDRLKGSGEFG